MRDEIDTLVALKGMLTAVHSKVRLAMAYASSASLTKCHQLLMDIRNDLDVVMHNVDRHYEEVISNEGKGTRRASNGP